jgi:DNA repair exonuclease SbcCD ATPase subunit
MILFKTLRWKNLLSTGNIFTEVELDRYKNTLVIGENGSGKSTMLDALCFALFGKPFRKINKPNLVNSINQKDAIVELEFDIGKKPYKIIRGLKPNIFEIYCDGNLINQEAKSIDYQDLLEKTILKVNYKSFTQIVILGAASFVPFMQLSAADRRMIIEELLDIQIFSSMNSLAKTKLLEIKESIQKNKYDLELVIKSIEMQKKHIEAIKQNTKDKADIFRKDIEDDQKRIQEFSNDIENLTEKISKLSSSISDKSAFDGKLKKLLSYEAQIESNIKKHKKVNSFLKENASCPTCFQDIDEEFKKQQTESLSKKIDGSNVALVEIEKKIAEINLSIKECEKVISEVNETQSEINHKNLSITTLNKNIQKRLSQISNLNDSQDSLNVEVMDLNRLESAKEKLISDNKELIELRSYYDAATILLKDSGIKTKIIKQYLPIINKLVNKYLASLDFFVNFNLDESFKETIKSRHRDEFSYESFSEGEKQRIDMALMLTWRSVAKLKSSINTNLLILDEIFDSSLDANGTEELIRILHELESTNLFVISHKSDQLIEKFDRTLKFTKVKNFSRMQT